MMRDFNSKIYFGNNQNKLLVYNVETLELIYEYQFDIAITTTPLMIDKLIVLGLASGEIAIINEEAFGL